MIESATLADLDAICEIERHSFRTTWTRETLAAELAREHAHLDVYRDARGVLLGFHDYWLVPAVAEVHVLSIATHPDFRRRGIAGALLRHALDAGRAIGATLATLEVRRGNRPAIALYERCGFQVIHVRARYYQDDGEDALVMTCAL